MIRLRRTLERCRAHPILGPLVVLLLVLVVVMVSIHTAHEGDGHSAIELGAFCLGVVTLLMIVMVDRLRRLVSMSRPVIRENRGPPTPWFVSAVPHSALLAADWRTTRLDVDKRSHPSNGCLLLRVIDREHAACAFDRTGFRGPLLGFRQAAWHCDAADGGDAVIRVGSNRRSSLGDRRAQAAAIIDEIHLIGEEVGAAAERYNGANLELRDSRCSWRIRAQTWRTPRISARSVRSGSPRGYGTYTSRATLKARSK